MSVCIRIKDAVKKYGDNTIISDLSLNLSLIHIYYVFNGEWV